METKHKRKAKVYLSTGQNNVTADITHNGCPIHLLHLFAEYTRYTGCSKMNETITICIIQLTNAVTIIKYLDTCRETL